MGLSKLIKKVGSVVQAVAPIASFVPGPIGMAGMAITALSAAKAQAPAPQALPMAASSGFAMGQSILPGGAPSGFPSGAPDLGPLAMGLPGLIPRAAGLIGGAARAAAGLVRTAAGKVRGVFLRSGRFISSKKGAALAKRVGIDAAAAALGVSTIEMAEMVLAAQEGARRGRGLSARDMKITKRTIRTVDRLHDQIVRACRGTMPARRSFPPRAAACPPVRLVKVK